MARQKVFFLAEEDQELAVSLDRRLRGLGHSVGYYAQDLDTALTGAQKLKELGINIALISSSIGPEQGSGERLRDAIFQVDPEIKLVVMFTQAPLNYGNLRYFKPLNDEDLLMLSHLHLPAG